MKYSQLVSMPSAVSDWLEEQLEARGIDAVVYTRYILSLLHSDAVDVIYSDEDLHSSHLKKGVRKLGAGRKYFRSSSDWSKYIEAEGEKLKRSAAVECLMSASDQTFGIESLVDELCEKLNETKSDVDNNVKPPVKKVNQEHQEASPQELAKRYYAAFPPLNRISSTASSLKQPSSLHPLWVTSPKKKLSFSRKQNSIDIMKSNRSSGRQRYGAYFSNRNNNNNNYKKELNQEWKDTFGSCEPRIDDMFELGDDEHMYDDLPVDIKELLDDSPTSHDETVEMKNFANMRDTGKKSFLPCGTNILSSIWTNEEAVEEDTTLFDNNFNSVIAGSSLFNLISVNMSMNAKIEWDNSRFLTDNERNLVLESSNNLWNYWSPYDERDDPEIFIKQYLKSLSVLKHVEETSAFVHVPPNVHRRQYNPFSRVIGAELHRERPVEVEKEGEDLLTSFVNHFRPINENEDNTSNTQQGHYADGSTFVVSTAWDKINYQRTDSGSMYLENDYNKRKKYYEYKSKIRSCDLDFILKYVVSENDKACQTDDEDAEVEALNLGGHMHESYKSKKLEEPKERTVDSGDYAMGLNSRSKPASTLSETEGFPHSCDNCNKTSALWDTNTEGLNKDDEKLWQFGDVSKIWSGGVVCHACLGRPPSTRQHSKLREDVSQDGDQLLSDLRIIQKSYMQECDLPFPEFPHDINEILSPKDRKRRHSMVATHLEDSWSFASRLEEDCLIQMSTLPTLRSVTL